MMYTVIIDGVDMGDYMAGTPEDALASSVFALGRVPAYTQAVVIEISSGEVTRFERQED